MLPSAARAEPAGATRGAADVEGSRRVIWLVGGGGMLGGEVRSVLERLGLAHFATGRETEISSEEAVRRVARERRPRWIVNCAAYTAVDKAESEEVRAHAVNALGPRNLARAAREVDARVVHVSTDYVFDGRGRGPYPEDAPTNPIGAYGRTKAAGEAFLREEGDRPYVVRTAWLHGPGGANFVATMLRLMAERPELRVVDDQRGSPTYAADLAEALVALVARGDVPAGTYHFTNEGECTWHAFALEIQAQANSCGLLEKKVPVHPIPTSAYPTPATRPANSVLSKARIRDALALSIPSWQDGLARHLRRLRK
jgi:dTDP-4-dehydrorhamnose reductase